MSLKSMLIGSAFLIVVYLIIVLHAAEFANKISYQTEQNIADAIRVMEGAK